MKTVLVVEDSSAERCLIAALLRESGFDVALADGTESALTWLQNNGKPDLIVLDIVGLELCRQLCHRPEMENVPIVFYSSKNQDFDRFWALRQGGIGACRSGRPLEPSY